MGLIEFIDLVLGLFFTDDGLTGVVLERFEDALMVQLHLLLLLLLLLELQPHELVLLLGHGTILYSLALQRFVLLFKLLDDLFKLLDALDVGLLLLLLGFILLPELLVEARLEILIAAGKLLLGITKLLKLTIHHLFALVPLLSLYGSILLFILELVLKFEDLLGQLLNLG